MIAEDAGMKCVGTFESGELALSKLPELAPDVILMDINLKGMSGIECTRQLKQRLPSAHILMLTMFDDTDNIFAALKSGATGYLLKRFAPWQLVSSIQEALAGGAPMTPQIARRVVQGLHENASKHSSTGELDQLTERENELLSMMARGKRYKEVADGMGISMDTVRSHIRRIYRKLHVHSRTEAVVKYLGDEPS